MNPTDVVQHAIGATGGGHSFYELFMQAHIVVKVVMIGLVLASVWSWAIIVAKIFAFRRARREADRFEQMFWSGQSLEELYTALSRAPHVRHGGAVCRGDARVEALRRGQHSGRWAASSCASKR
jgi:biopolymer transport protein ExbB/TolQ